MRKEGISLVPAVFPRNIWLEVRQYLNGTESKIPDSVFALLLLLIFVRPKHVLD